ncbi:glycosyltransferase [Vibrio cholerae]|uniref:glycosyltransferase n=1 Tax=Vibrio cholerae TaxID=666 RepID=UPI001157BA7E|nr:glycosyltransferase [Vibrio cholerae]TQQ46575.1 glycosyltransferase [Vibrio cholerae]HDZ9226376.1 glycosyltransferase [Vibrio cholerae]
MISYKKKIYFLLSSEAYLEPVSGDRINEMNVIKAMLDEYEVYYNGILVKKDDKAFGDKNKIINIPKEGEYDLVYIRNNKDVFLKSPSPKLWFASPYDEDCFNQADGIVCMTKPWKNALSTYDYEKYDYFKGTYPVDMLAPKACILFPQVIDDSYFSDEIISPKNIQVSQTIKQKILNFLNFSKPEKRTIRHFGPIRPSNYPYQIISALSDKKMSKKINAECIGAGKKVSLPSQIVNIPRIPQEYVSAMLKSASAIWYNQDATGHIAGSLKVLEAMAAGVPILLPRYDARVDELGEEYPFFWDLEPGTSICDSNQNDFFDKLNKIMSLNDEEKSQISIYLKQRAQRHSKENVAKIIKDELNYFWGKYNE